MEKINEWININAGEEKRSANAFVDRTPLQGCRNKNSLGIICERCNRCGRFNVKTSKGNF